MQGERNTIIISIAITSIFILVLITFIAFIILQFHRRQIANQKGIESLKSNFEKTLLSTQLEIQEQTFHNISREIHDNIGLSLTLAKLNLNTIYWNNLGQAKEKVFSSTDLISKAIEDLSFISKTLHTDYIKENGLLNALDMEICKIRKLGIFVIQFDVTGLPVYMTTQKELVIFRIIQEVLNNSIKHAQATQLRLILNYQQDRVLIEISDNGTGFEYSVTDQQVKKGTGLMNIINRASFIEGFCKVNSKIGVGTVIQMQIPY